MFVCMFAECSLPRPSASASTPSLSPVSAAGCGRSSPAWRASSPGHSADNPHNHKFKGCVEKYNICHLADTFIQMYVYISVWLAPAETTSTHQVPRCVE